SVILPQSRPWSPTLPGPVSRTAPMPASSSSSPLEPKEPSPIPDLARLEHPTRVAAVPHSRTRVQDRRRVLRLTVGHSSSVFFFLNQTAFDAARMHHQVEPFLDPLRKVHRDRKSVVQGKR